MKILTIEEPYWSAWQKYGWENKVPGIGISNVVVGQALHEGCFVYLYVSKDPVLYMIDPKKVMALANQYQSIKTVRAGIRVAVIPQTSLIVVQGIDPAVKLADSPPPRLIDVPKTITVSVLQRKVMELKKRHQESLSL